MTNEETQAAEDNKIVRMAVARVAKRLPSHIDPDDLFGYGIIGLLEARSNFDSDRGVKFATFAVRRVDGAILDYLRSLDWVPRSVRRSSRELEAASRKVSSDTGAEADPEAIAEAMGLTLAEYHAKVGDAPRVTTSMDIPVGEDDMTLSDVIGGNAPSPAKEAEARELSDLCLSILTDDEKAVVVRSIVKGDKLREIGSDMGIGEARTCQIRTKALKKMRTFAEAA
jgi:RNA polymerase sigma factor for flagellar operon FliA